MRRGDGAKKHGGSKTEMLMPMLHVPPNIDGPALKVQMPLPGKHGAVSASEGPSRGEQRKNRCFFLLEPCGPETQAATLHRLPAETVTVSDSARYNTKLHWPCNRHSNLTRTACPQGSQG